MVEGRKVEGQIFNFPTFNPPLRIVKKELIKDAKRRTLGIMIPNLPIFQPSNPQP